MKEGIYLFPSKNDFLKVIDKMIAFENDKTSDFLYLHKHLTSSVEVDKEILFINTCKVNCFNGFKSKALIKVCLTSCEGDRLNITYSFKTANSTPYEKFFRYFMKRGV